MTASPPGPGQTTALQGAFRAAMASVCTPVSVVTTLADGLPHGTTVSAFVSLSMQPPMVLVSLDLGSDLLALIRQTGRFGLNVLSSSQTGLALNFAVRAAPGSSPASRGRWPRPCPASRRRRASWRAPRASWWQEVTTSWCSGTCSWPPRPAARRSRTRRGSSELTRRCGRPDVRASCHVAPPGAVGGPA